MPDCYGIAGDRRARRPDSAIVNRRHAPRHLVLVRRFQLERGCAVTHGVRINAGNAGNVVRAGKADRGRHCLKRANP